MPDISPRPPDYVLSLMANAAKANQSDLFRRGHLIELPNRGDVLVTGDLHGHLPNFQRIVKLADLPHHPQRHLILQELLHCMYEDTPDTSYHVLEEAAILKTVYPSQVHILLANHDLSELLHLDIMKRGRSVLRAFEAGLEDAYQFNRDVIRKAYMGFVRTLPWAAATATGVFVAHSVPDQRYLGLFSRELFTQAQPALSESKGTHDDLTKTSPAFRLVWGRDLSGTTAADFAARVGASLVLTGHHPCRNGYAEPNANQIILDCKDSNGAYVILPLDQTLSQQDVLARIRHLHF